MKKKRWKIEGRATIEVKTIVETGTMEEAEKIATDREISICVHGTGDEDATEDWVYVDAPDLVNDIQTIDEF
jgi:hypothetical protein